MVAPIRTEAGLWAIVEGWSVVDSVYFCSMSLATVGYGDIQPYYDKVDRLLGVSGDPAGLGHVPDGIFQRPTKFTDAEILRTNLASVILQMTSLRLGDMDAFPFIDPPDRRSIKDGVDLLGELGATWSRDGQPYDETRQIITTLERVIGRPKTHPGALHLWIHLWEATDPKKAEAEAARLRAEADAKRRADAEAARQKAEVEAQQKAEAEAKEAGPGPQDSCRLMPRRASGASP